MRRRYTGGGGAMLLCGGGTIRGLFAGYFDVEVVVGEEEFSGGEREGGVVVIKL